MISAWKMLSIPYNYPLSSFKERIDAFATRYQFLANGSLLSMLILIMVAITWQFIQPYIAEIVTLCYRWLVLHIYLITF